MTVITERGLPVESSGRMQMIDFLLSSRKLIGDRRWGMVQLYYRAGLSHQEISDIFGLSRQAVTGQLRRALRLVLGAILTGGAHAPDLTGLTRQQRHQMQALAGKTVAPDDENPPRR